MKFSARFDIDSQADALFDSIADFSRFERMMMGRGATVTRIDPAQQQGIGMGWLIGFLWRGRSRDLRLEVTRFDRPERLSLAGHSDSLDIRIDATVIALSKSRSRLIFECEIRPRNMKARLMLQTAKLGKSQLDRKFERRVAEFLQEIQAAH
ncbi:SRPBCC family protein [Paracoccus seriniphilus]|uniref:Polyketide cyclase / dehydrase and lipid transport n=1 Tax=Paracoccus seriniphilus TaxID=184748 RepID=A0A239Q2I9_9RHOB|nr:SRPBCC family protein [Paracoccus seriniphilus]WCR13273.1 SRPBCC family protein [Paracoccus seriniphilus]SNT76476.1 hypothetical protein SAMN05444959_12043 [Paracoccus seriniphilus]